MDESSTPKPQLSLVATAAAGGGLGYTFVAARYLSNCVAAGKLLPPSPDEIAMTLGFLTPAIHLVGRIVMAKLTTIAAKEGASGFSTFSTRVALALIGAVLMAYTLAGCANSTTGQPPAAVIAGCTFAKAADQDFQAFAANHELGITCSQVKTEAAVMVGVDSYCANPAAVTNVDQAIATLGADALAIAGMYASTAPATCAVSP